MRLLYDLGIWGYGLLARLLARLGHAQARAWVAGRQQIWRQLEQLPAHRPVVWFHTASAGEFEQGRPLIEAFRAQYPQHFILLSFFSPSGYGLRKDYAGADLVTYLPEDRPALVDQWLQRTQPVLAIFIKYEFWKHHFAGLKRRNTPLILISTTFREGQPFFRWPTKQFWGEMLTAVSQFYVQDATSAQLLSKIGHQNYQLCGDTRVDRVMQLPRTHWHEPTLAAFAAGGPLLVAGSTWPADEKLLLELLQHPQLQSLRLLIAPHQPSEAHSVQLQKLFGSTCQRYSQTNPQQAALARVLVLDTIGMLNKAYRYGQFAYVGGGFGKSIHNLLEPAVYGIPVFFGPKHHKFPEAFGLQQAGMGHAVHNRDELQTALLHYWQSPERQAQARQQATHWFAGQAGATQRILADIQQLLPG